MKIHIVSETEFAAKGQGVHTAHVDLIDLLKGKNAVEVLVNGEGKGDVFHSHTYGPYYFWKGRSYKGKRIHTVHVIPDSIKGSIPFWKLWMPLAKWYFKQVYNYADVCIAISPMVEKAIKELGVTTRISRISNPIPLDKWRRTPELRTKGRKLLNLREDDFVVLGVGQLQERKGVHDFIEIAEKIPEAQFIWAGGRPFGIFTDGIKKINDKISRAADHIQFIGMIDLMKMPEIYAAADLMLFPSYQENCPLAPLEAAASGIPVVFRDLIEYELLYENPYLKATRNSDFVYLTLRMLNDSDFYNAGQRISAQLIKQFDKDEIHKKLIHLYEEVLADANASSFYSKVSLNY